MGTHGAAYSSHSSISGMPESEKKGQHSPKELTGIKSGSSSRQDSLATAAPSVHGYGSEIVQVEKPVDFGDMFNRQKQESLAMLVQGTRESRKPPHVPTMANLRTMSKKGKQTPQAWGVKNTKAALHKSRQTPHDRYRSQLSQNQVRGRKNPPGPPIPIFDKFKVDIDSWPPPQPTPMTGSNGRYVSLSDEPESSRTSTFSSHFPSYATSRRSSKAKRPSGRYWGNFPIWRIILIVVILLLITAGTAVGIVFGLKRKHSATSKVPAPISNLNATESGLTPVWRPAIGSTWQIQQGALTMLPSFRAQVHCIDLFDNNSTTIAALHELGRRVICSFSAGTMETGRPDANKFDSKTLGTSVANSQSQTWIDTRDQSVRDIMAARIQLAKHNGCDGVDPNHVDGYSSSTSTGFQLTADTGADYVRYLATQAHSLDIAIGLHNSPELIEKTLDVVDWQLNEGCAASRLCADYHPFILAGKPVFHIEYATNASEAVQNQACNADGAIRFSTLIKRAELDTWSLQCPYGVPDR